MFFYWMRLPRFFFLTLIIFQSITQHRKQENQILHQLIVPVFNRRHHRPERQHRQHRQGTVAHRPPRARHRKIGNTKKTVGYTRPTF